MLKWKSSNTNQPAISTMLDVLIVRDCRIDYEMYLNVLEKATVYKVGEIEDLMRRLQNEILRLDTEGYYD
ncbi:MAG: hypothetical protein ACOC5T_08610 [Elusimicrobiota bacterium]